MILSDIEHLIEANKKARTGRIIVWTILALAVIIVSIRAVILILVAG